MKGSRFFMIFYISEIEMGLRIGNGKKSNQPAERKDKIHSEKNIYQIPGILSNDLD